MIQTPCEKGNVKIIKYFENDLLNNNVEAPNETFKEINVPPQNEITYRLKFNKTEELLQLQKDECHQVAIKFTNN